MNRWSPLPLVAALLATALFPGQATADEILARGTVRLPLLLGDQAVVVEKSLDAEGRIVLRSTSSLLGSPADLDRLLAAERDAERKLWGALSGELRDTFAAMKQDDTVRVVVYPITPKLEALDKHQVSEGELIAQSRQQAALPPRLDLATLIDRYALGGLDLAAGADDRWVVEVDRKTLDRMRFDPDLAAIELYREESPLVYPLTTYTYSAYNPAPLPTGARGGGVHVSTFETGIHQDVFDCLGNLDPAQVDIDNSALFHSNLTFTNLWLTAPEADFYHHDSLSYGSTASQGWLIDHGVQTASMSYTRGGNENQHEFLVMDDFAYRWPFPVFANPTANSGYQYEANWQQYNGINVGNVKHAEESWFELAGCTQTRNPDPVYGSSLPGTPAGDRELPNLVAPGITPADGSATDPCLGSFTLWCGTSVSAPILNGVAGDVISSDPRMVNQPEAVKAALLLTAQNVEADFTQPQVDERDGVGVVSGSEAVWFARNHTTARPGTQAEHALATGSLNAADEGHYYDFYVRVPTLPIGSRHFRAVLVWTSNPDVNGNQNSLSDLDLSLFDSTGSAQPIAGSYSLDDNVEVIDLPKERLTPGALYTLRLHVTDTRIPAGASASFFYYALGWTWPRDFFFHQPVRGYDIGVKTSSYCDPGAMPELGASADRFCQEMGYADSVRFDLDLHAGVHTWWNGSSWSVSGNNQVCFVTDLVCRTTQPFFPVPTPAYQIGVYAPYNNCGDPPLLATLDASGDQFCRERSFDWFSDYAIDGPRGGVHTYWTGTHWTTTGNGQVCFMEQLGCARQEICSDGIDNDSDGYIDEGC